MFMYTTIYCMGNAYTTVCLTSNQSSIFVQVLISVMRTHTHTDFLFSMSMLRFLKKFYILSDIVGTL